MCGIVGLVGEDAGYSVYEALVALQHRGQDAAGICTYDGRLRLKKGVGLVSEVFRDTQFPSGVLAIGHVRYPTIGLGASHDAQPFIVPAPFGIALAHNGNIVNYTELRGELWRRYKHILNSDCDAELLLAVFAEELAARCQGKALSFDTLCEAVSSVFSRVNGSYSAVALIAGQGLVAFRDPHGIKPLSLGRCGKRFAFVSESVALDVLGFEELGDVAPGEVVFVDVTGRVRRRRLQQERHALCIFEFVYFARPDSVIDGISVYEARLRLGERLAERCRHLRPDVVVPVPDTARAAAVSLAAKLAVPYREGLIKNRYIGRTFIMPSDAQRRQSVRVKLNPIKHELHGRRVLLVDDSIVRGTTSRAIVDLVRSAGAKEVFFAITAPPLRYPCVYGIDMQTRGEFIAATHSEESIAKIIGADALVYQTLTDLVDGVRGQSAITFCCACFDGKYPTHVDKETLRRIEAERRRVQLRLIR